MDVTFFEGHSYDNSHLQGWYNNNEDDCLTNSDFTIEFGNDEIYDQPRLEQNSHITDTVEASGKQFKFLVYTKKRDATRGGDFVQSQSHESTLWPNNGTHNGTSMSLETRISGILENKPSSNIDLPIAQRNGVRSCTKLPFSNFVSYKNMSPSYCSFMSDIDTMRIPNNVHDALKVLEWKKIDL